MMIRIAGGILALALMVGGVGAQNTANYPERPIVMMVSYGAGGATDYQARIVTMRAGDLDVLGMPIAIINKPGNGGRVGWNWLAGKADTDGYTIGAYNVPHFLAQSIKGGVDFTPDSFEPIANWGADPAVFVVSADSPLNSMQDVADYATANPGEMTVSGAGFYVGHHIAALQLERAAGITLAYTPSNIGGAAAMKEVVAGTVQAGINNLSDAFRARAAGGVKILGLFDLERHAYIEDVPTLIELGFEIDDASVNYRGVMVPKDTDPRIIETLAARLPIMFKDPAIVEKMTAAGAPMRVMNRAEVQRMWAKREATLKELLSGL